MSILEKFFNRIFSSELLNRDSFKNGLICHCSNHILGIGLTTSVRYKNIDYFLKKGINTIVSHHPVDDEIRLYLINNNINLFVYHFPLDNDKRFGNNILNLNILGIELSNILFNDSGLSAQLKKNININHIIKKYTDLNLLKESFIYGSKRIKSIGIVTGGGDSDSIEYYEKYGVDVFITGEVREKFITYVMNHKKNYILLDHYKSELISLKSLGKIIKKIFPNLKIYVK